MKRMIFGLVILTALTFSLAAGGGRQAQPQQPAQSGPVKLSYYEEMRYASQGMSSRSEHPIWKELQKRLNIEIDFRSPQVGNERETFNLMMASRDFPDILTYSWYTVAGGPGQYIADNVIIKLNEPIDKWAPDVKKAFAKYPQARREATMDDGTLYCFPQIYSNEAFGFWFGPLIRRDLLDKVPSANPAQFPGNMETLEEWERILTAVKNAGFTGDSGRPLIPLCLMFSGEDGEDFVISGFISGAWGIHHRFTQENGRPVYGPADPRFREYMVLMNRWYQNGLLDAEFAANDWDTHDEKFLDNRVFAIAGAMGGHFTSYTTLLRPKNPDFKMATTKYPVLRKGDQPVLAYYAGSYPGIGAAITTACKNVEAAARLLNYDYSDEGFILANFGIEGQTFNWEPGNYVTQLVTGTHAGYPRYTDQILNNPNYPKDIVTAILLRVRDHIGIKAPEFLEQRDSLPEQVGPLGRGQWMIDNKNWMPAVTATQDESAELGRIMNDINTYADEMFVKFVTGAEPLNDSTYNTYIQTIRRMDLDRALQIVTAQLDRYNKRP